MSIVCWFLKSKKAMAKPDTQPVKIGKYKVTSHAQNKTVDRARHISKIEMVQNLLGNSVQTKPYPYRGELQYDRIHPKNKTVTHISMKNSVKTIHKVHDPQKEIRKRSK